MEFLSIFGKIMLVMCEIFIIALCGFIVFKFKLLSEDNIQGLSKLTINLFLPCLIFDRLIKGFRFDGSWQWLIYPVLGIVVSLMGVALARIVLAFDKQIQNKNEFIGLIAFQNCGYLPLMLVWRIFPAQVADNLFINIFLFMLGFNLIFWSYGIRLLTPQKEKQPKFKRIMNAPLLSLILSLVLVATNLHKLLPGMVTRSVTLIGGCTLPIALIIVGAVLAISLEQLAGIKKFLLQVILGKMIIMPGMVFLLLHLLQLPPLMALVILIESAMPSAITLSVITHEQKAGYKIVNQGVLLTHLAGLATIPFFMSLSILLARY